MDVLVEFNILQTDSRPIQRLVRVQIYFVLVDTLVVAQVAVDMTSWSERAGVILRVNKGTRGRWLTRSELGCSE